MNGYRLIISVVAFAILTALSGDSYAQSGTETLTTAAKLGEKGDYAAAVEKIGEAFKSGNLDNAASSKAFLMRGEAYEKLGKSALALADYTNAVFMQGLSSTERPRAVDGRKRVLASLGVADNDGGAKPLGATQSSEPETKSNSGGFFSGLFGGSSTSANAKPEATAPSGWSEGTRVTEAAPTAATDATPAKNAPQPSAAAPKPQQTAKVVPPPVAAPASRPVLSAAVADDAKQYNILLASLDAEKAAQVELKRIAPQLSGLLQGKKLAVVRYEKGGAVFYRVVAGPYEGRTRSAEVCESLKAKKLSCQLISQ